MAIIHRRIFHAKAGAADNLLKVLEEGFALFQKYGAEEAPHRLLTDYMSGRSDRVVDEVELNSIGELEALLARLMSNPQFLAELGSLQQQIFQLADYSEVEHWAVR